MPTRVCYCHLRRLRQLRCHVGQFLITQLILAFILSFLDYNIVVLFRLPKSTNVPRQCVQNAAARLVFSLHQNDHITTALLQFH
jgi:hypothetical protein